MIKLVISNDFVYKNENPNFEQDSYCRKNIHKTYFCGILICDRTIIENIEREKHEHENKNIGFK